MGKAKVEIHPAAGLGPIGTKNPPIDADKSLYLDSAAGDAAVTSTWAQIKAFLKTYFDTLYAAIGLAHNRLHPITSALDHSSAATPGRILRADGNGLPVESANTDAELADAVVKRHTQNTDTNLGAVGVKNPPIDTDKALYRDSAAADALVTSTWTQIKAFLKTYFDTIYGAIALAHTQNTDIRIQDADGDTKIQVEESADEDKIRMDVKGVEAFLLNDVGVLTLAKQSGCKAYRTGALSVPRGSYQKINLNAEIFDIQSEFDTGTYKFTAKTAGLYLVVGTVGWNDYAANAEFDAYIFKNGVSIQGTAAYYPVAAPIIIQCTTIASLAVNDYLELYTYCGGSGTAALVPYEPYINLYVAKIA